MSDLQDKRCWGLIYDAYREMYAKATPKADFDKMRKTEEWKKEGFFYNYHLPKGALDEIINKFLDKKELKKRKIYPFMVRGIRTELYLGCAPCTCEGENPDHKSLLEGKDCCTCDNGKGCGCCCHIEEQKE